jgi:glycolate oxidase FAD binding subunit
MDDSQSMTIDGVGPMPVVRPSSAADAADVVRKAAADGTAVYPVGGGTMLDYGLPPARPGVAVDLRSLDKVIDFPARDMTITVEAGVTIARLNEITRAEGLHLPIDVPDPDRATVGGAIACNVSGPRRYGYGTFRDYVLGITTVNDRGELVAAGGRVVKNVAGYDLMKLHTGALGTLGVITLVTLKLRPVPEALEITWYNCRRDRLAANLGWLAETCTRPTHVEFTWGPNLGLWGFYVGFEGSRDAVEWQVRQTQMELTARGNVVPLTNNASDQTSRPMPQGQRIEFRASLRPSGVAEFCSHVLPFAPTCLSYYPANVVVGGCSTTLADAKLMLDALVAVAATFDGNMTIERCPPEWKKSLSIWGRPPADIALQKAVKRSLDPNNLFNPGRFVTDAF